VTFCTGLSAFSASFGIAYVIQLLDLASQSLTGNWLPMLLSGCDYCMGGLGSLFPDHKAF